MKMPFLYYTTSAVQGGVGILGMIRYKKVTQPLQLLIILILYWLIIACVEFYMQQHNINTLSLWQINNIIEMLFFTWIYYLWQTSKLNGKTLFGSLMLFLIIWIIGKLTFEPFSGADDITWGLSRLIQVFFGINVLLNLYGEERNSPILKNVKLLVSSAFVIYSAGTFFLFSLFTPLLKVSVELTRMFYYINWVLIIVAHILYAQAILSDSKEKEHAFRQLPKF